MSSMELWTTTSGAVVVSSASGEGNSFSSVASSMELWTTTSGAVIVSSASEEANSFSSVIAFPWSFGQPRLER